MSLNYRKLDKESSAVKILSIRVRRKCEIRTYARTIIARPLVISVLVIEDVSLFLESHLDVDIDIEMRWRPSSSSQGIMHSHDVV